MRLTFLSCRQKSMVYLPWQKEEQKGVGLLCKSLGKIPSKENNYIFTRCTENQEYISFIVGKIAIIFHIMEVTFKTSFQFASRALASFKQSHKLCMRDWIRQFIWRKKLDSEMLEVSSNSTFLWEIRDYETFKLHVLRHFIPDYIICSPVSATNFQRLIFSKMKTF